MTAATPDDVLFRAPGKTAIDPETGGPYDDLAEIIIDAWASQAPERLVREHLDG